MITEQLKSQFQCLYVAIIGSWYMSVTFDVLYFILYMYNVMYICRRLFIILLQCIYITDFIRLQLCQSCAKDTKDFRESLGVYSQGRLTSCFRSIIFFILGVQCAQTRCYTGHMYIIYACTNTPLPLPLNFPRIACTGLSLVKAPRPLTP